MSQSNSGTAFKALFWTLTLPVCLLLLFSLFMALEALIVFGSLSPLTLGIRFILLLAPVPQVIGLMHTLVAVREQEWARAIRRITVQLVIVGTVVGSYLALVLA